jgi:two-component system, response regulator RegA
VRRLFISFLISFSRYVVLTGYASIATAVEAIKLGATQYLTKPVDADEIVAAFGPDTTRFSSRPPQPSRSMERVEHEHIRQVLSEADANVSETARRLGMHRRSLQRKLTGRSRG